MRLLTPSGCRCGLAIACLLTFPALAQQPAPLQLSSPLATDAALDQARSLLAASRPAEAEALLRTYLLTDERSAPARYLLARTLLLQDKPKDALAEFTHAAGIEPPSSENLVDVARAYVLLNDYPDAALWLGTAVGQNPLDAEAWYSLGRVQYTQQLFADALGSFRRALALRPRDVKAENNLGLTLEALNRTDEAVQAYRNALAWQADAPAPSEQPMINLATVLIHRGQLAEALPLLERAAEVAPKVAAIQEPIQEQLGHLYLQEGKLPQARDAFARALVYHPGSSALHFLLGQTYRRMGLKAQADEQFRQSAAIAGVHSTPDRQ